MSRDTRTSPAPRGPARRMTAPLARAAGLLPWRDRGTTLEPLLALARAAASGRPARLTYRDTDESVPRREAAPGMPRREVEVLSLGWRWRQWVALVRCEAAGGLRVLEVERVETVRLLERRRRPRGRSRGADRARAAAATGLDPLEFALADLQDAEAGPVQRVTVALPSALAPLAGALFAGAVVEPVPGGARVHLLATNRPALAEMVASLGLTLG